MKTKLHPMTTKIMNYLFGDFWDMDSKAAKFWEKYVRKNIRKLNKLSLHQRRELIDKIYFE